MEARLTIGQLAECAGVTVRTVRHYHQIGLLPEPQRDSSGYRRYGAANLVALSRISALAQAGVPLTRIGELLSAEPSTFAAVIEEIENSLDARIADLQTRRDRVSRLSCGERLVLPDAVAVCVEELAQLGVRPEILALERDSWTLLIAMAPDAPIEQWAAIKLHALADPALRELYRRLDRCYDWDADDRRLIDLARDLRAYRSPEAENDDSELDDWSGGSLLDDLLAQSAAASPAWRRLVELTG